MVYPYNNDIGKKSPEPAKNFYEFTIHDGPPPKPNPLTLPQYPSWEFLATNEPELSSYHSALDAEIDSIKHMMLGNPWNKSLADKLPVDTVLIPDKNKFAEKWGSNLGGNYQPMSHNLPHWRMRLTVDGMDSKKYGIEINSLLPPGDMTESMLRLHLQNQFKQMENKIIEDIKKAKGIS